MKERWKYCRVILVLPLLLTGCFHETTELQPAHFAAAREAGVLLGFSAIILFLFASGGFRM
jgi:hypothetical protein